MAQAEPEVRIAISKDRTRLRVSARGLRFFDAEVGDLVGPKPGSSWQKVQLKVSRREVEIVDYKKRLAGVLIEADGPIKIGRRKYLGRMEVSVEGGRLRVINRLKMETYLLGIVGSEMSPSWPAEALKAQAVAARTYAMHRRMMMRAANKPYDLESTVLSQVYRGATRIRPSVVRAVKGTSGEVMAFQHDLVEALFHSTCGGHTDDAEAVFGRPVPYLRRRPCRWCRSSNRHRWSVRMPLKKIATKLQEAGLARNLSRVESPSNKGTVELRDARGARLLASKDVRRALGYSVLYSPRFSARTRGDSVHFSGRGFGHGVGMCQWGARGQALAGRSYRQILRHYYHGADLRKIY